MSEENQPDPADPGTDPKGTPAGQGEPPKSDATGKPSDDWQGKYDGMLQVNRDLEAKLNQFRDGLKSALGVEDKKADAESLLSGLQKQLADMQHSTLVAEVARRHGITDEGDIEFLRSAPDQEHMTKLAKRIAPVEYKSGEKPPAPKGPVLPGHGPGGGAPVLPGDAARAYLARKGIEVKTP